MVKYSFRGSVPNSSILDYYNRHDIECFIQVSENEGLPVAIMEAESAGIPIIATEVGGIKEMIDDNGVLLPSDSTPETVSNAILSCIQCSDANKAKMSRNSRRIWEEKFDAHRNSVEFVHFLRQKFGNQLENIIFLTEGYPFVDLEKSFLECELREMVEHYNVTIVPRLTFEIGEEERDNCKENIKGILKDKIFNNKIKVLPYCEKWSLADGLGYVIPYFLDKTISKERKDIIISKEKILIRFWESIKYYGKAQKFKRWVASQNNKNEITSQNALMYSYWNLQPLLGVCLGNKEKYSVITRVHGFDYQDEQWPKSGRKPFLKIVDDFVDAIVFVSYSGMNYLLNKLNKSEDERYAVSYVGSNSLPPYSGDARLTQNNSFKVVSCSSLIPLKRVNIIIDALKIADTKLVDRDIEWVHFGDGPLRRKLEKYAQEQLGN